MRTDSPDQQNHGDNVRFFDGKAVGLVDSSVARALSGQTSTSFSGGLHNFAPLRRIGLLTRPPKVQ
jgi:hypothetical protein